MMDLENRTVGCRYARFIWLCGIARGGGHVENPSSKQARTDVFLHMLYGENSPFLEKLESDALRDGVPIIRKGTQSALRVILAMKKPETILEIGTAVGFSSLFFCEHSEACVTTIESWHKRADAARENFRAAGVENRVTLLEGDAAEIVPGLSGSYDFIFLDAAKGQYAALFPEVMRLLKTGGVLVTDNVLEHGEVLESRYAVRRRDRTIHTRLRAYLRLLTEDPRIVTSVMEIGDGLAVSVKKGEEDAFAHGVRRVF